MTSQSTQVDEVTLWPEDLERIAILFDKIRTTQRKKIHTTSDKEMAYEFDEHLKSCMQGLSEVLQKDNLKQFNKNHSIMNTKHRLIDICWDKSLEYLTNNSPEITEVFKSLWNLEDSVFQEYSSLYLNSLASVEDETIVELRTKLEKHQMETNALLEAAEGLEKDLTTSHQTIEKLKSEHRTEIEEMRAQMEEMQEENKMLLD